MQRLLIFIFIGISLLSYSQENKSFKYESSYHKNIRNVDLDFSKFSSDVAVLRKDSSIIHLTDFSNGSDTTTLITKYNGNQSMPFSMELNGNGKKSRFLFPINDSLFILVIDSAVRLLNNNLTIKWSKKLNSIVNFGQKISDSTFVLISDNPSRIFRLNIKGSLDFTVKEPEIDNSSIFVCGENIVQLKETNSQELSISILDDSLKPVKTYHSILLEGLARPKIKTFSVDSNKCLISNSGRYYSDLFVSLLDLDSGAIKSTKIDGPLPDEIIEIHKKNDSLYLGFGKTRSLGKGYAGWYGMAKGSDIMIFTFNDKLLNFKFSSLGLLTSLGRPDILSPYVSFMGNEISISYLTNYSFENKKMKIDSLQSCDAIYLGDSIYKIQQNHFNFSSSSIDSINYISDTLIIFNEDSIQNVKYIIDNPCENECDFNVFVTANLYNRFVRPTYIKVEVVGKNPPFEINWGDAVNLWERENLVKARFIIQDNSGCEKEFEYSFDRTSGVMEFTEKPILSVYPNPTNGVLKFSATNAFKVNSLQIYDLFGRVVYALRDIELFEGYSIDLSHLQNGVYFVVSHTENNQFTNRIIISK